MKNNENNSKPDAMGNLLKEWKVTEPLPPRFQEQVWHSIARAESTRNAGWWAKLNDWLAVVLPQPAFAVAAVSVFLVVGLAAGYWQAQVTSARMDQVLADRYTHSVAPSLLAQR